MARPRPQAAITKAPTKTHPIAPTTAQDQDASPRGDAGAERTPGVVEEASMVVFSARISSDLRRRVRIHAAVTGMSVQEVTAIALSEHLDRHSGEQG